ncbi:MAG TPA: MlaD family protein [Solirubrobacterales bacterium]|jgi:ABC-type transporter Mla subunit MlaD
MRKWLIAGGVVAVVVAAIVLLAGGDGEEDAYVVRGIFDSSSFLVAGEEVRVAGATVGEIESVDVTRPGETTGYENGQPQEQPGKAALSMKITDPGFQDFRSDATCVIRPQSLIGEKFVDCRTTLPRAPGSPLPPPLKEVPEGEPGEGEYLLPLENNGTIVDQDLVNNLSRLPYTQRFRLIFNELGAGLAGRGDDLEEVVKRANPVLRDVDRLLGILAEQRDQLAQLTSDSDEILVGLSRERTHVAGFFSNAGAAAEASAERGEALEESFEKLPAFLREFRLTMRSLKGFSDAAAPVFSDFGEAGPSFTKATEALAPFSEAATVSLKALGDAGETSGPILRSADPIVIKLRDLGKAGASPTTKLAKFLVSTKQTKGWDGLVDLIYNNSATLNEFDQYGHFARGLITLSNCLDYATEATGGGCVANFTGPGAVTSSFQDPLGLYRELQERLEEEEANPPNEASAGAVTAPPGTEPEPGELESGPASPAPGLGEGQELGVSGPASRSQRALLDYLLGP